MAPLTLRDFLNGLDHAVAGDWNGGYDGGYRRRGWGGGRIVGSSRPLYPAPGWLQPARLGSAKGRKAGSKTAVEKDAQVEKGKMFRRQAGWNWPTDSLLKRPYKQGGRRHFERTPRRRGERTCLFFLKHGASPQPHLPQIENLERTGTGAPFDIHLLGLNE